MGLPGKTKGYFQITGPEGNTQGETITCCHCNGIEVVDRAKPARVCEHCWAPVCANPQCNVECTPFEKKLEALERGMAHQAARSSIFRAAGIE